MCNRYYVLGTTCAGKDYMMEQTQQQLPHLVGLVQVGKEMRRRYPPGHFQGQGAPEHTEVEALSIYKEQLAEAEAQGYKHIFIAGQPRRISQIEQTVLTHPGKVLWVYADDSTLRERAGKRGDAATVQLSLDRITNDKVALFDVLFHLMEENVEIIPIHTSDVTIWIRNLIYGA